jgi:opacity protein-like surface antigen
MACSKRVLLAAAMLLSLATAASAQAPMAPQQNQSKPVGWWGRFWRDYHRNQAWPDAFIPGDRAAVNTPFQLMADNGWQRQNLLCDYHFSADGQTLSPAGEYRLNWIATQAPAARRTVFVQRGATPGITVNRVDAVQQSVARLTPTGPLPRIMESDMDSAGYAGEEVDAVTNGSVKTRPDPRIPAANPTAVSN